MCVTAKLLFKMPWPLILLFLQLWGSAEVSPLSQECPNVPVVLHAQVSEKTQKTEYHVGDGIVFTCETGYVSGLPIRYLCTDRGWTKMHQGQCYLKPCELPEDTPNGQFELVHGEDFVFGSTIKYSCNVGYQMVSKEDTRTCFIDNWTNHVPICRPWSCDPPPADGRLQVKGLPGNDDPILPNGFLTFSCDGRGQYLNGSKQLICGNDGQWDKPFPSCEDIICEVDKMDPNLSVFGLPSGNETMKSGHELQFQCHHPYILDGSNQIICLETGKWSTPMPTCNEGCVVASVPTGVVSTHSLGTKLKKGEQIRFHCSSRQHQRHGNEEVECLPSGRWSGAFPTCGPPSGCGKSPPLDNGDTESIVKFNHNHKERVKYICQNYHIMEGDPYLTCDNGEWNGRMRCLKPCTVNKDAMNQHGIAFKYTHDDKLYSEPNDTIEFRCTRGSQRGTVGMRQMCNDGVILLPTCS